MSASAAATRSAGGRLATGDDEIAFLVNLHFHTVQYVIFANYPGAETAVGLNHGSKGIGKLFFNQPAHFQHMLLRLFKIGVKLLRNMMAVVAVVAGHGINWSLITVWFCVFRRTKLD